jgi:methylmalonyl-CoA mutase C-terminal domain/subunit
MNQQRPIKVLIAKPGLDGHDRGAKVVSLGLKDEGMEVIYTGIRQTPETIVRTAVQEDVDVVGLSLLSGAHRHLFREISSQLAAAGMEDVLLIGGGVIPDEDVAMLKEAGFGAIFGPGTSIREIAEFIKANVKL